MLLWRCSMDCELFLPLGFNNSEAGCAEYFCLSSFSLFLLNCCGFNALQITPRIAVRLYSYFLQLTSTLFIYDYGSPLVYSLWLFKIILPVSFILQNALKDTFQLICFLSDDISCSFASGYKSALILCPCSPF